MPEQALELLNQAIALNDYESQVHVHRAQVLFAMGRYQEVVDEWEKIIAREQHRYSYEDLIESCLELQKWDSLAAFPDQLDPVAPTDYSGLRRDLNERIDASGNPQSMDARNRFVDRVLKLLNQESSYEMACFAFQVGKDQVARDAIHQDRSTTPVKLLVQVSRCRGGVCCGRIVLGKSGICYGGFGSMAVVGASMGRCAFNGSCSGDWRLEKQLNQTSVGLVPNGVDLRRAREKRRGGGSGVPV